MDLTPALYEWEVLGPDVTPPSTIITKGPPEGSSTPNWISIFEFSGTDDFTIPLELDFECTLDGVDLGGCSTPEEIEVFTPGPHQLVVRAIDDAGNIDPDGAVRNWTVVDMSGPDTEIVLAPEEEAIETSALFTFEGFELLNDEPVNEFECAIDEGEFRECPGGVAGQATYADLAIGPHSFHVRAVDPDGNRDISPAFYEWLILVPEDTTPPDTFIVTYPIPANSGPDVTFGFASNEPVEMFECSMGLGTPPAAPTGWEECDPVWMLEGLPSGQHWLWVRALDIAENPNTDPTPAVGTAGSARTTPTRSCGRRRASRTRSSPRSRVIHPVSSALSSSSRATRPALPSCARSTGRSTCRAPRPRPSRTSPARSCPARAESRREHEFEVRAVNQYRNADGEQVIDMSPADLQLVGPGRHAARDVLPRCGRDRAGAVRRSGSPVHVPRRRRPGSSFELEFQCAITNTTAGDPPVWEECGEPAANDSFFHEIVFEDYLGSAGDYTFQVRALDFAGQRGATPAPVAGVRVRDRGRAGDDDPLGHA